MLKICSIIIAKNEAENIKKCIESQLACIDEIIVIVDSKTTDSTLEIAKSYPKVKAELADWMGYSGTKTYAVSKTVNEWIFWIDADEVITPELSNELKEFKNNQPAAPVFDVARRAFFLGKWIKHCGWYPSRVNRLFNKKLVKFSNSEVHEHLVFDGAVLPLKYDLEHFTDPSLEHYLHKFNKYTSLAAQEMLNKNRKFSMFDIILRPPFLFLKMYIFRLGFLDGAHGLVLSLLSSFYVLVKYSKLWEISLQEKKE